MARAKALPRKSSWGRDLLADGRAPTAAVAAAAGPAEADSMAAAVSSAEQTMEEPKQRAKGSEDVMADQHLARHKEQDAALQSCSSSSWAASGH